MQLEKRASFTLAGDGRWRRGNRQGWDEEASAEKEKCALNTAASYLGCLSKEIWQLCERQTGMEGDGGGGGREISKKLRPAALTQLSVCLRLLTLIVNVTRRIFPVFQGT